jgi:hypothetical protein
MRDNKAAGTDGIPAELFTHACPVDDKLHNCLIPYLTHLFNVVLHTQNPRSWGACALIPVFKGKGNPNSMDTYRGIAVGIAISKLFSIIITNRLDEWADVTGTR